MQKNGKCGNIKADMVLINGRVYSPTENDKVVRGEAVIVEGGLIKAICSDNEAKNYIDSDTEIIDCCGNSILPGLCDAHCHPNWSAGVFESCQLFDITGSAHDTVYEVIDRYLEKMREYVLEHDDIGVIRGTGWNRAFFSGACSDIGWPTRHDLDKVCSDRPVIMESYCQHALWVNTKAIEMAGLSKDTSDPDLGRFTREADGYPAGLFFEMEGKALIENNLPGHDYSVEQYKRSILRYQDEIAMPLGLTLINDCLHTENATLAYKELAEEGKMNMRVRGVYHFADCSNLDELDVIKKKIGQYDVDDIFVINTIKIFMEGEFMTLEPYEEGYLKEHGLPERYRGTEFYDDITAKRAVAAAMETGLQIHIHAMGDRAVRQAVDSIVYGQEQTGKKNRNVIAHVMLINEEDKVRMGQNGIIASCQPRWMIYDSDTNDFYQMMFGKRKALECYPNKSLIDAGCIVAYGTDFPVTPPPNPFHGMQCAITRSVFEGDKTEYGTYKDTVLGPEDNPAKECVSLKEAVKGSSWSGAYQMFLEDVTGSIEPGKSAELIVLDRDIEQCSVEEIYDIKVKATVFKGRKVYSM